MSRALALAEAVTRVRTAAAACGTLADRLAAAAEGIQAMDQRYAACMIWLRDEDRLTLAADAGEHFEECPIPPGGGISRTAVSQSQRVVLGNNKAAGRTMECYLFAGSELAVPIPGPSGETIGALHLQSEQLEAFTPADEALAAAVAAVLGEWF